MMRSNTRIIGYLYHLYQININHIALANGEDKREKRWAGGHIIHIIGCRTSRHNGYNKAMEQKQWHRTEIEPKASNMDERTKL